MNLRKLLIVLVALGVLVAPIATTGSGRTRARAQDGPPGSLEVIGHESLEMRGMNAGLAVKDGYAYIGSRTDNHGQGNAGVMVVDIKNPAAPKVVSKIEEPNENNEGETSRELRIWPEKNLLIVMNLGSNCGQIHACSPNTVDDNYRFYDISGANAAAPKFIAEYKPSVNPHEMFLWDDPKVPGRALLYQSTPGGQTSLTVADISDPKNVKEIFKGQWVVGEAGNDNRLHSLAVTPDGTRAYFSYLEAGFYVADTSDFANGAADPKVRLLTDPSKAPKWPEAVGPGLHSAVPIWGQDYALLTDEVYGEALKPLDSGGCPWGWVKIADTSDVVAPKIVAEYKLEYNHDEYCTTHDPKPSSSFSAHNPTLTQHLAFVSWHSGGLQVIDVSDPKKPTQAAQWFPDPEPVVVTEDPVLSSGVDKVVVWSYPIIQAGLIYVVDIRNGLYVLRYKGPYESEVSPIAFLEGNSNLGDALLLGGASGEPEP
ncbi:MAG: hypothetical protein QOK47_54, partial [Actinomycetota bacterium]|nr:hypothetical protein [Actinomycetota bacterium]